MPITNLIRDNWCRFQGELFPEIQAAVGPLLKNHQRFVMVLEMVCPENFIRRISQKDGRPLCDQVNLARAFLAKAIWDIPTTRALVERLKVDRQMRNLCGWVLISEVPSESTFSRAFAEFTESEVAGQMHEALEPFAKLRPNSSPGTASLYEDWILVSTLHDSFGFAAEFRPDSMKNQFKPSNRV